MSAYIEADLADTIGATTTGTAVSLMVSGFAFQQGISYLNNFPNDRKLIRNVVMILMFLNLLHTSAIAHMTYYWTVIQFRSVKGLDIAPPTYGISLITAGLITGIVQVFYGYRIQILCKHYYIPRAIYIGAFLQCVFASASGLRTFVKIIQSKYHEFLWAIYIWFVSAVAVDIIITCTLLHFFQRCKSSLPTKERFLNRLSILTIQTNAVTAVLSLIVIVVFASIQNGWNRGLYFVVVPLYVLSLLASLNSRIPHSQTQIGIFTRPSKITNSLLYPEHSVDGDNDQYHDHHEMTSE